MQCDDGSEIDIIGKEVDGKTVYYARVIKDHYLFEELLPLAFFEFSKEEMAAHFKRFVTPALKFKLHKAMELKEKAPELLAEVDKDADRQVVRIEKAMAKRERKKTILRKHGTRP